MYDWMDRMMTQTDDENNLTFSSTNNQPMTIDIAIHVHVSCPFKIVIGVTEPIEIIQ